MKTIAILSIIAILFVSCENPSSPVKDDVTNTILDGPITIEYEPGHHPIMQDIPSNWEDNK